MLELILGPMFSGKSTELLRRMSRHIIAKRECLLIKYKHDERHSSSTKITHSTCAHTHTLLKKITPLPCLKISEIKKIYSSYDVIGIDEGQFYPDIVDSAELMANEGKHVIIAALDGDYKREPFGDVLNLIPKAESVCKLNSVCMLCGNDANFTQRIGKQTQTIIVGGQELYRPLCRKCYFQK